MADRVGGGRVGDRLVEVDAGAVALVVFDLHRDAVHHRHRFLRPHARGGLGRKHDRVGAVVDRVGDVGHFGAGRLRALDHRFEHLRGDDHRLAEAARGEHDALLQRGHFLRVQLDAEVAAGDHYSVCEIENFGEPRHGHRLLDLGAERALAVHQLARFGDVVGTLDEAEADPVGAVLEREGEVAAVLLGQRGDRHLGVGHVDALLVGNDPADLGGADDRLGTRAFDPQADLAVVDQQPLAFRQHGEQLGMRQEHSRFVARRLVTVEREAAAVGNPRLAALERADAQLGALQVAQDRDRTADLAFERADRGDRRGVDVVLAVAQVDAKRVGPGAPQAAEHVGIAARRSDRREDLDLAAPRFELVRLLLWHRPGLCQSQATRQGHS